MSASPSTSTRADTFVIVTARDEEDRIGATLAALALALPDARVLVADDGSSDGTAGLAREHGARVVRGERALGKGEAATRAARAVLQQAGVESRAEARERDLRGADGDGGSEEPLFLLCDADLGSSAGALGELVAAVARGDADLAIACFSRRVGGGFGFALAVARWAIRRRSGYRATAPLSGQRAMRGGVLREMLPFAPGFGMEVGMTIDAVRAGYRVAEVELDLSHRVSARTPAGFAHRARQLLDIVRAYRARA